MASSKSGCVVLTDELDMTLMLCVVLKKVSLYHRRKCSQISYTAAVEIASIDGKCTRGLSLAT